MFLSTYLVKVYIVRLFKRTCMHYILAREYSNKELYYTVLNCLRSPWCSSLLAVHTYCFFREKRLRPLHQLVHAVYICYYEGSFVWQYLKSWWIYLTVSNHHHWLVISLPAHRYLSLRKDCLHPLHQLIYAFYVIMNYEE
jgi:hypothetical protein